MIIELNARIPDSLFFMLHLKYYKTLIVFLQ